MQRWKLHYDQAPDARRLISKQVRTQRSHGRSPIKGIKILVTVSLERKGVIVMITICETVVQNQEEGRYFFPCSL